MVSITDFLERSGHESEEPFAAFGTADFSPRDTNAAAAFGQKIHHDQNYHGSGFAELPEDTTWASPTGVADDHFNNIQIVEDDGNNHADEASEVDEDEQKELPRLPLQRYDDWDGWNPSKKWNVRPSASFSSASSSTPSLEKHLMRSKGFRTLSSDRINEEDGNNATWSSAPRSNWRRQESAMLSRMGSTRSFATMNSFNHNNDCWDNCTFASNNAPLNGSNHSSNRMSANERIQQSQGQRLRTLVDFLSANSSSGSFAVYPSSNFSLIDGQSNFHSRASGEEKNNEEEDESPFGNLVRNEDFVEERKKGYDVGFESPRSERRSISLDADEVMESPAATSPKSKSKKRKQQHGSNFVFRYRKKNESDDGCGIGKDVTCYVDPHDEEETMAGLIDSAKENSKTFKKLLNKNKKRNRKGDSDSTLTSSKQLVFVLAQIHRISFTEEEFGDMQASDVLHLTSKRPVKIDIEFQ